MTPLLYSLFLFILLSAALGGYGFVIPGEKIAKNHLVKEDVTDDEARIIAGSLGEITDFPYIVSLQLDPKFYPKGKKLCGGAIIRNQWILTAAHCFEGTPAVPVYAHAGSAYAFDTSNNSQSIRVSRIFKHPSFTHTTTKNDNDIALLKLVASFNFTKTIQSIALPQPEREPVNGTTGVIMGWGATNRSNHSITSDELLYANMNVTITNFCYTYYGEVDNLVCVENKRTLAGSCPGDSGGPYVQIVDGIPVAVGVSATAPVFCGYYPSGYTKVNRYYKWLIETMDEN